MHGQLQDLSQSDKTALWVVAATMTFAAVTSLLGLVYSSPPLPMFAGESADP